MIATLEDRPVPNPEEVAREAAAVGLFAGDDQAAAADGTGRDRAQGGTGA